MGPNALTRNRTWIYPLGRDYSSPLNYKGVLSIVSPRLIDLWPKLQGRLVGEHSFIHQNIKMFHVEHSLFYGLDWQHFGGKSSKIYDILA